jgi:hypothetical protein
MPGKFCIYSTEVSPVVDPHNLEPAPTTIIRFDHDPMFGGYRPEHKQGRGSTIETFGGAQIQDFGMVSIGGVIEISDTDALSSATIAKLITAYEVAEGQYFFTDGYSVWKVQFQRQKGFSYFRNLKLAFFGKMVYSYDIQLVIISQEV